MSHSEIIQVELDDPNIEYEALSIVRGEVLRQSNHDPTFLVADVGGACLAVTETLSQAVGALQLQTEDRYIWAHQNCIDQLDLEERASQVALMSQKYQCASKTVTWLGRGNIPVDMSLYHLLQSIENMASDDFAAIIKAALEMQARL